MFLALFAAAVFTTAPAASCANCSLSPTPPPLIEARTQALLSPSPPPLIEAPKLAPPSATRIVFAAASASATLLLARIPISWIEIGLFAIVYSPFALHDATDNGFGISRETGDRVITSAATFFEFVNIFFFAAMSAVILQSLSTDEPFQKPALFIVQTLAGVVMLALSAVMRYRALPRNSHPYFQEFAGQAIINRPEGAWNLPLLLVGLTPVVQGVLSGVAAVADNSSMLAAPTSAFVVPLVRMDF